MVPLCWDGACCLRRGGYYVSSPLFFASVKGDDINTKSRVVDGGFALAWMAMPTVGKRVFLLVVSTIPTVMRCMTPSTTTVKKAASGRSKSPAFAGTKTATNRGPSPNPPKGREFHGEVPFWVSLRGEGTNLLYTICLILFVFLICNVEIRVLVFLIILGWSVLIVASHIIRGIWSMG